MNVPYGAEITITTRTVAVDENGQPILDSYGNPTFDETTSIVTGIFSPSAGTESTNAEDRVTSTPQAFLPITAVIASTSKLTVNGLDYEVTGEPEVWASAFSGWRPGIAVNLRRSTG